MGKLIYAVTANVLVDGVTYRIPLMGRSAASKAPADRMAWQQRMAHARRCVRMYAEADHKAMPEGELLDKLMEATVAAAGHSYLTVQLQALGPSAQRGDPSGSLTPMGHSVQPDPQVQQAHGPGAATAQGRSNDPIGSKTLSDRPALDRLPLAGGPDPAEAWGPDRVQGLARAVQQDLTSSPLVKIIKKATPAPVSAPEPQVLSDRASEPKPAPTPAPTPTQVLSDRPTPAPTPVLPRRPKPVIARNQSRVGVF